MRTADMPVASVRKSERTRAAILNAGLDFLWSHPFRDLTVGELMSLTSLSRPTFYQYFDDVHDLMQALLNLVEEQVFAATSAWLTDDGDPIAQLATSLTRMVENCYRLGPILRATSDAASGDERLHRSWNRFLGRFDDAVTRRIEADQNQGLVPELDASTVAVALNRLNVHTIIDAFGQRPRRKPFPVQEALVRIWVSTLYGSQYAGGKPSGLARS